MSPPGYSWVSTKKFSPVGPVFGGLMGTYIRISNISSLQIDSNKKTFDLIFSDPWTWSSLRKMLSVFKKRLMVRVRFFASASFLWSNQQYHYCKGQVSVDLWDHQPSDFIYSSICLSTLCLSACPSIYLSIYLCIFRLSTYISIHLTICISVYWSTYLYLRLSSWLYFYLSIYISILGWSY